MSDRLLSCIGLCKKAGKLVEGFQAVSDAANESKVKLIVTATDISPKSEKEVIFIAQKKHIEYLKTHITMDELSHRLGRRVGILAVSDTELAKAVKIAAIRENEEEQLI